jgi:hypothetical protein
MEDMIHDWLPIVQSIGIPGSILLMLMYAGYRIVPWVGQTCVVPVVARHIQLIDKVEKGLDEVTTRFHEITVNMRLLSEAQVELAKTHSEFTKEATNTLSKVNDKIVN